MHLSPPWAPDLLGPTRHRNFSQHLVLPGLMLALSVGLRPISSKACSDPAVHPTMAVSLWASGPLFFWPLFLFLTGPNASSSMPPLQPLPQPLGITSPLRLLPLSPGLAVPRPASSISGTAPFGSWAPGTQALCCLSPSYGLTHSCSQAYLFQDLACPWPQCCIPPAQMLSPELCCQELLSSWLMGLDYLTSSGPGLIWLKPGPLLVK